MVKDKFALVDIQVKITDLEGLNIEAIMATANSMGEAMLIDIRVVEKKEGTY